MRLTVVGCSGSFPSQESAASCYLFEAEDDGEDGPNGDAGGGVGGVGGEGGDVGLARTVRTWRVALDLGSGALGPLQRHLDLDDLDAVVLSHLHPDHFLDLCGLYVALRYRPGGPPPVPLPVHGPPDTARRLAAAHGMPVGSDEPAIFDHRPLADGVVIAIGPLRITARRVRHPVETYGFRIEHHAGGLPGERAGVFSGERAGGLSGRRAGGHGAGRAGGHGGVLAYSGDTDSCDALVTLAADADLLLAEASFQEGRDDVRGVHLTGRRAGEAARDAGARALMLTHVPVWTDPDVVAAEARAVFDGPVLAASAGTTHRVGA